VIRDSAETNPVNSNKPISIGLIGAIGLVTLNARHPEIPHIHPNTDVDLFRTPPVLTVASSTVTSSGGGVVWVTGR
jgi:hypothetical protein